MSYHEDHNCTVEWKDGRLYIDGEPLLAIFTPSAPSQGSRIVFERLTPEESAVVDAAIKMCAIGQIDPWDSEYGPLYDNLAIAVDALNEQRNKHF